jgi:dihydrofolate reductase
MGRKIIAALQVSLDGFIEGPNGEMDWAMEEDEDTWNDVFEMLSHVDTFILGRKMYPGYEQYWLAVLANPNGILPFSGRIPSKNEIAYAHLADKTPHMSFPKHWTRSHGKRHGSFGMWKKSGD